MTSPFKEIITARPIDGHDFSYGSYTSNKKSEPAWAGGGEVMVVGFVSHSVSLLYKLRMKIAYHMRCIVK